MTKILGISGSITGSKTEIAVHKTLKIIDQNHSEMDSEFLNLKDYDLEFCDGRGLHEYNASTQKLMEKIEESDCFIIGSPVFQGSIPGVLKNVFDLMPPDMLRHKVIGFITTGGTYQHYLVVENQLKPIAGYFRSYVAPSYVYLNNAHFNSNKEITDEDVLKRLNDLAEEVVFMHTQLCPVSKV